MGHTPISLLLFLRLLALVNIRSMKCLPFAARAALSWRGTYRRNIWSRRHPVATTTTRSAATVAATNAAPCSWCQDHEVKSSLSTCSRLNKVLVDDQSIVLQDTTAVLDIGNLPPGIPKGFYVVQHFCLEPSTPLDWTSINLPDEEVQRLDLDPWNVTLPIALMMVNPIIFPTLSRARKACRKGRILVHRGPLVSHTTTRTNDEDAAKEFSPIAFTSTSTMFGRFDDPERCIRGRVGDRVSPGDVIAQQVRMGNGYFPVMSYTKPPFELPVLYEDDHFALVNKPAGVVVYAHRNSGHGLMTVRAMLPFVLKPPSSGTYSVLRRPAAVHRLDKSTSGILCIAKTKPAMLALSRQFHDRVVRKTYMAVVNGIPPEPSETSITSHDAHGLGVDVDPNDSRTWQLIDSPLEEKSAVTIWRSVRYVRSLYANDGYLTLVELKPKTGRHHQLRRHMAWHCHRPIVGDKEYDEGSESAMKFRDRGLFLCSVRITLEHPYYNSQEGRRYWNGLDDDDNSKYSNGSLWLSEEDKVMVSASVELPDKFESLLSRAEERFDKFLVTQSNGV